MSECIAMAIGFIMGAGCVILSVCLVKNGSYVGLPQSAKADSSLPEGAFDEREKLVKQWENILNYDGTEKGQVSIEEGEE